MERVCCIAKSCEVRVLSVSVGSEGRRFMDFEGDVGLFHGTHVSKCLFGVFRRARMVRQSL